MNYYLTTYDSVVLYVTGVPMHYRAANFAETLTKLSQQFAEKIGVRVENIEWQVPMESSLFSNTLLLMAQVDKNWQLLDDVRVFDEIYCANHKNMAFNKYSFIHGDGLRININDCPPINPHNLFHTQLF